MAGSERHPRDQNETPEVNGCNSAFPADTVSKQHNTFQLLELHMLLEKGSIAAFLAQKKIMKGLWTILSSN